MMKFIKFVSCMMILVFLRTGFALAADQVFFYYTDPSGTPLAVSDATGAVTWQADYMPFGEELLGSSTAPNNKMFVGKEKDGETGFYYFGARYMDSTAGRFVSTDSIGPINPSTGEINQFILHDPQRLNPYVYGLNNSYRYVDKDGNIALVLAEALFVAGIIFGSAYVLHKWQEKYPPPAIPFPPISLSKKADTNPDHMLGEKGTQVISIPLWRNKQKGRVRIDVENPAPGKRPGDLHIQDDDTGGKWHYDPKTGDFKGAPDRINDLLNREDVKRAIEQGLRILGEI
jgi:RHS repeat-associated protein